MNQRFNYLDFLSPHNRLKPHFSALAEAVLWKYMYPVVHRHFDTYG